MYPAAPPNIWRAGGLDERRAARFLSVSESMFKVLRKREGWRRKRIKGTAKVVYSRVQLREFLASCEDA
ncbi:MAG TPA: hypothetical protein VGE74_08625 [Gemmata sp.]